MRRAVAAVAVALALAACGGDERSGPECSSDDPEAAASYAGELKSDVLIESTPGDAAGSALFGLRRDCAK